MINIEHEPYAINITINDLRTVVEMYLRDRNISLDEFSLATTQDGITEVHCRFQVVYLEHNYAGDIDVFLERNFLTSLAAKRMAPGATELLHYFAYAGDRVSVALSIIASLDGGAPLSYDHYIYLPRPDYDMIQPVEITLDMLKEVVADIEGSDDGIEILACNITAGEREFSLFMQKEEAPVAFYFRNAFNVYERCDLQAVTTHKPKSDRSIAVTHRLSTFYNQQNEKQYDVESTGLTLEQARWIEQLFYSHDVRLAQNRESFMAQHGGQYLPQYMPKVLITDFTCEIHDEDGELNSVKFTYQLEDGRPLLQTEFNNTKD